VRQVKPSENDLTFKPASGEAYADAPHETSLVGVLMRAIVQNAYGSPDVFELTEVKKPVVKDSDVLVRVQAAGLNAGDYFSMRGSPWAIRLSLGLLRPKNHIPGWDVAGRVEAVGEKVKGVRPGDDVYGGITGACAEYASGTADQFAVKPANLSFEQAAAVPTAALTALQALRDHGKIQPGQKVLINGASGGVGTFAVQIAKSFGAEVTGVCSTRNINMVRSIGADHVIDYTKEDFTQSGLCYDLLLDNVGNHSFSSYRRVLAHRGALIPNSGHGGMGYVFNAFVLSLFMRQQGGLFITQPNNEDLVVLKELIETGKVTPVIDRTYQLSEISEAFRYLDQEHARGKVVITVEGNGKT
jgi:NADPH:quinone reductase-like Zn-dependent oxidoreductase